MSVANFSLHSSNRLLEIRFDQDVEIEDLYAAFEEITGRPEKLRLWEFGSSAEIDTPDLRDFTDHTMEVNAPYPMERVAIVAPLDLPFGLARMHAAFTAQGIENRSVFRTKSEALEWLMNGENQGKV